MWHTGTPKNTNKSAHKMFFLEKKKKFRAFEGKKKKRFFVLAVFFFPLRNLNRKGDTK